MNKKILFLFLFMFSLAFVSSAPPFLNPLTDKCLIIEHPISEPLIADNDHYFEFHAYNCSDAKPVNLSLISCSFHLYNSSGMEVFSNNDNVTKKLPYDITQLIKGGNFSIGNYAFEMQCNSSNEGGFYTHDFQVTPTGEPTNNTQLYSRIFLLLFFMLLIFLIQWNQKSIDYDKWYNSIAEKYQTKNTFRWILSAVGYNMFKNSYIFSYLVGLLGLLVLTELTVFFNITSVISIMKIVLGLYTWGALVVVIVFFSQVQEWIMEWKEDIEKMGWGDLTYVK